MKQKLLNSLRLRVSLLVVLLSSLFAGQSWATSGDVLSETFEAKLSGWVTGGTSGSRSNSNSHGGSYCYQFGGANSTNVGSVQTPALSSMPASGKATLEFWAKGSTGIVLKLTGTNCSLDGNTTKEITVTTSYVKYTVNITSGSSTSKIKFEKKDAVKGAIYIDDIVISSVATSLSAPDISPDDGSTFTGTQSVTITQDESKDVYYTTDGTTPTSSSTKYTGAFDVAASAVTGEVTVKAIAIDGSDESDVATATYTDTSIQPTLISLTTNYEFLGVDDKGSISSKFTKTVKGVGITIDKTSGNWARGDDTYIRIYANNFFKVDAPSGYNVKQVVFTSPGTWGAEPTVGGDAISSKTWTGEAASVQFDFSATNYISAVAITLVRALPYVVSFGDLNTTSLKVGDDGTFSTPVTPYTGSLAAGVDYEVEWSSSDDKGLAVAEDGTFEATKRGAYKVTATATALDDETYRDATKEYDVTVTEKVSVLADDVVIALGDDPKAITKAVTDGYAGKLTYESDNTSVATVDASGNVTAVAKGTTTITISSPADASHYFTAGDDVVINVTVKGQAGLAYTVTSYKVAYGASFPTPALTNPHDLAVTYSKTGDNVATVDPSTGAVTILSGTKGTARITASFAGNAEYAPGSAYYDIKVYDPDGGDGSELKPYSVDEALDVISELDGDNEEKTAESFYVTGIVSELDDFEDGVQYFYISDDGTASSQVEAWECKYLGNVDFTNLTLVKVGDEVTIYGTLQNYKGTPYINSCYLTSFSRTPNSLPHSETFATSFGDFVYDGAQANSTNIWNIDTSNGYAKATSYISKVNYAGESWLVSPEFDGTNLENLELSFSQCVNKYFGKAGTSTDNANIANEAMVYAKEEGGDWTKQTISGYPSIGGTSSWSSFETATVDLSAFDGKKFQIAFVYIGTSTTAGTWEIKNIQVSASVPATLGTNGYTTYASPYALDLTAANLPTGVEAYKASVEGTTVTFTEIDQAVPANTGILLKGEASATVNIPVAASGTAVANNAFEVNAAGTTFTEDDLYYYFGLKKNTLTFALFDPSSVAIPANKAYLKVLKSSIPAAAKSLNVVFDETTGISTLERIVLDNEVWYDLQGRRVTQPTKGIYIHNGKKIFVK